MTRLVDAQFLVVDTETTGVDPQNLTVIVDGRFVDHLCLDEALGVVASALFSGRDDLPYVKTYAAWDAWDKHFRRGGTPVQIAGFLTCGGRP